MPMLGDPMPGVTAGEALFGAICGEFGPGDILDRPF